MTRTLFWLKTLALALIFGASPNIAAGADITPGKYLSAGGNYSLDVVAHGDGLQIREPNWTSTYLRVGPNEFHYVNPKSGKSYGVRYVDSRTFEAFLPGIAGNVPARYVLASNADHVAPAAFASDSPGAVAPRASASAESEARATKLVKTLQSQQWNDAAALFNPTRGLDVASLNQVWSGATKDAGRFLQQSIARSTRSSRDEVVVDVEFEKKRLSLHVVFESGPGISNFFIWDRDEDRSDDGDDLNVKAFFAFLAEAREVYWFADVLGLIAKYEEAAPGVLKETLTTVTGTSQAITTATWSAVGGLPQVRFAREGEPVAFLTVTRLDYSIFRVGEPGKELSYRFGARGYHVLAPGRKPDFWASGPEAYAAFQRAMGANSADYAAIEARERADERQSEIESRAALANGYAKMASDLSAHAAREIQIRADADAMLADIAARQALARQQQTARAAETNGGGASALRESGGLRAQPVVGAPSPQPSAGLTVTPVQARPTPVSPPKTTGGVPGFVACAVLKPGSFDGHNGAWFFSAIVPITIVYGGPPEDWGKSFIGKVRATYGITGGHHQCRSAENRSEVQAWIDSVSAAPSYSKHKRVQTGIAP